MLDFLAGVYRFHRGVRVFFIYPARVAGRAEVQTPMWGADLARVLAVGETL